MILPFETCNIPWLSVRVGLMKNWEPVGGPPSPRSPIHSPETVTNGSGDSTDLCVGDGAVMNVVLILNPENPKLGKPHPMRKYPSAITSSICLIPFIANPSSFPSVRFQARPAPYQAGNRDPLKRSQTLHAAILLPSPVAAPLQLR